MDLELGDGQGLTIISDQQKGLEIAIKDFLPHVEHRNCARHVYSNRSGRKKSKEYEFSFWVIVKASTQREWEEKRKLCSSLTKKLLNRGCGLELSKKKITRLI